MSGFSAEWLTLREAADAASRDAGLIGHLAIYLADRPSLRVADLGCGTGSLLRALAPRLPAPEQHWQLLDGDPALLAVARDHLAAWADTARADGDLLLLERAGRRIAVETRQVDLAADPLPLDGQVDLVAATALFDLVSESWAAVFVSALVRRGLPLYAALSYDGDMGWTPSHPFDAAAMAAIDRHQRGDKGFGPAMGPEAVPVLARLLGGAGRRVILADSPWLLGPTDAAMVRMLVVGHAAALRELPDLDPVAIDAWEAARLSAAGEGTARIGHLDLLSLPG